MTYGALSVTVHTDAESVGTFTASAYAAPAAAGTISLDIRRRHDHHCDHGGVRRHGNRRPGRDLIQNAIDGNGATVGQVTVDTSGGFIRITNANADVDVEVNANAASFAARSHHQCGGRSPAQLDQPARQVVASGSTAGASTLTIAVNGGANQTITFGTGVGEVSRLCRVEHHADQPHRRDRVGRRAPVARCRFAVASSSSANSLTLTGTTGVPGALNISNGTINGTASVSTPNATRTCLAV